MTRHGSGLDLVRLGADIEARCMSRSGRRSGDNVQFICPAPGHEDKRPSASYSISKQAWFCHSCSASGGLATGDFPLAKLYGFDLDNYNGATSKTRAPVVNPAPSKTTERPITSVEHPPQLPDPVGQIQFWAIKDATGNLVAEHHRQDCLDGSKKVWWSRNGTSGLDGMPLADLPLYASDILPERRAGEDVPVVVCEGEKASDCLLGLGLPALGSVCGASSTPGPKALSILKDRRIVLWSDNDTPGHEHMHRIYSGLSGVAADVTIFEPEGLPPKGDAWEWVAIREADGTPKDEIRNELLEAIELEAYAPGDKTKTKPSKDKVPVSSPLDWQPFPTKVLPRLLRDYVTEVSRAFGCDKSMVAVSTLVAMAGAIGNKRVGHIKDSWQEPSILWGCIIAGSGSKKSPVLSEVLAPLHEVEGEKAQTHRDLVELFEVDLEEWEATDPHDRERKYPEGKPQAPDPWPRLLMADTTTEAVAKVAEYSPAGQLVYRDELNGWFGSFDAYRPGGDASFWTQVYGARPIQVDRKGRSANGESIFVPRGSVSVLGAIQPGSLRRALKADGSKEHLQDGLAARVLWTMPPKAKRVWSDDDISKKTRQDWADVLTRLTELSFDDQVPLELPLDADARPLFINHYNNFGQLLAHEVEEVEAAVSKLEGGAVRIALILELMVNPEAKSISRPMMEVGIRLAQWFLAEAKRVYTMLAEREEATNRRVLIEHIDQRGGAVTVRELQRGPRRFRLSIGEVEALLEDLVTNGYGKWKDRLPSSAGGRPTREFRLEENNDQGND